MSGNPIPFKFWTQNLGVLGLVCLLESHIPVHGRAGVPTVFGPVHIPLTNGTVENNHLLTKALVLSYR